MEIKNIESVSLYIILLLLIISFQRLYLFKVQSIANTIVNLFQKCNQTVITLAALLFICQL